MSPECLQKKYFEISFIHKRKILLLWCWCQCALLAFKRLMDFFHGSKLCWVANKKFFLSIPFFPLHLQTFCGGGFSQVHLTSFFGLEILFVVKFVKLENSITINTLNLSISKFLEDFIKFPGRWFYPGLIF